MERLQDIEWATPLVLPGQPGLAFPVFNDMSNAPYMAANTPFMQQQHPQQSFMQLAASPSQMGPMGLPQHHFNMPAATVAGSPRAQVQVQPHTHSCIQDSRNTLMYEVAQLNGVPSYMQPKGPLHAHSKKPPGGGSLRSTRSTRSGYKSESPRSRGDSSVRVSLQKNIYTVPSPWQCAELR